MAEENPRGIYLVGQVRPVRYGPFILICLLFQCGPMYKQVCKLREESLCRICEGSYPILEQGIPVSIIMGQFFGEGWNDNRLALAFYRIRFFLPLNYNMITQEFAFEMPPRFILHNSCVLILQLLDQRQTLKTTYSTLISLIISITIHKQMVVLCSIIFVFDQKRLISCNLGQLG